MKTVEQLREEENLLIEQTYGTPSEGLGDSPQATPNTLDGQPTPTSPEELPSSEGKSVDPNEDYEKRFKNLRATRDQNLYDAKKQLEARDDALSKLQMRLDELEIQANKPKELKATEILTKEEQEYLGSETISAVEKVTKTLTESQVNPLQKELKELREKASKAEETQRVDGKKKLYDNFLNRLRSAVPELDVINSDKRFLKYLDGNDLDGTTRFDNFKKAEQRGDVASVARYMVDFKRLVASKRNPLAKKVSPNAQGSNSTPTNNEPMTMAQVDKIYSDFAKGKYKGREQEFHELEQKIDLLASQGKLSR